MTAGEIAMAVGGELVCGSSSDVICGISTDSRTTDNTSLFIPLKGEKFDAHSFLNEVCKNGIGGYLCETDFVPKEPCFGIRVKDTGKALLDLASHYRKKFDIKVVALTGSVGKTTTKEMLSFYFLPAFGFLRNQPSVHFYFSYYKQNKYFSHSIPCYFHPEFQQTL